MTTAIEPQPRALYPPKNAPSADAVMTPLPLARACVQVLAPWGRILEPCAGDGAFVEALRDWQPFPADRFLPPIQQANVRSVDWFENDPQRKYFYQSNGDFLAQPIPERYDWALTNPPYSKYLRFVEKCFALAPNVAFLAPIERAFKDSVLDRATPHGHAIRAIWRTRWPKMWSRAKSKGGYGVSAPDSALGLVWWQQGYSGPIHWAELPEWEVNGGVASNDQP